MNAKLSTNAVAKTVMGEWVQVVKQTGNMVTVDAVRTSKHSNPRTQIHISKLLLHTVHNLSKKLTT